MTTLYAYDAIEQQHTLAGHSENRGRLATTMALLRADGILDRLQAAPVTPISDARLRAIHPASYVNSIAQIDARGGDFLDQDTYVVSGSYEAARAAAGAIINLTEAVMAGRAHNGMSLMRPPGHHALAARGMGFCLFANVALAAETALREFGAQRVLIIDWDVHHGNGTEEIFYDRPDVAFFSTHQYPYYPGTGAATDTGAGVGKGYTLNVPFPPGVGDAGYLRAFDKLLAPFARRFRPDLILVSAGYDAHWLDPLAMEQLSIAGFAVLTRRVKALAAELCDGRLVLALEGGYHLDVLAHSILTTLRILENSDALVSDPFGPPPAPERNVDALITDLRALHQLSSVSLPS